MAYFVSFICVLETVPYFQGLYLVRDFGRVEQIFPAYIPLNYYKFDIFMMYKIKKQMMFEAEINIFADFVSNRKIG